MDFRLGQQVILICAVNSSASIIPPPIGAVGVIERGLDRYADYAVLFEDFIWSHDDPSWEIPQNYLVPIEDEKSLYRELEHEC